MIKFFLTLSAYQSKRHVLRTYLMLRSSSSFWYPVSVVMLDCIDSWSLPSFLLCDWLALFNDASYFVTCGKHRSSSGSTLSVHNTFGVPSLCNFNSKYFCIMIVYTLHHASTYILSLCTCTLCPWGWVIRSKHFFLQVVMLHIKLKDIEHCASTYILSLYMHPLPMGLG